MGRSSTEVLHARASLRDEMAAGDLGDARLNARRNRLVTVLEQHPDQGFPTACGNGSDLEGLYRVLRNRRVSLDTVLEPHLVATRERCRALGEVLVIHDTTEHSFPGVQPRAGRSVQGRERYGFWLQAALAISAEGRRAPVGLLALRPFVRTPRSAAARGDVAAAVDGSDERTSPLGGGGHGGAGRRRARGQCDPPHGSCRRQR